MATLETKTVAPFPPGDGVSARPGEEGPPLTASGEGPENLSQIREILFGNQMQDYERRFARIEETIAAATANIHADLIKRVEALESLLKQELASLAHLLKTERDERSQAIKDVTRELRDAGKGSDKRIDQLGVLVEKHASRLTESLAASETELRSALDEQAKTLGGALQEQHELLSATIGRETSELHAQKTDRKQLAALLADLAAQLGDDSRS
jgi:hypothetical protein